SVENNPRATSVVDAGRAVMIQAFGPLRGNLRAPFPRAIQDPSSEQANGEHSGGAVEKNNPARSLSACGAGRKHQNTLAALPLLRADSECDQDPAERRHGLTDTKSSSDTGRTSRPFSVSSAALRPDAVTNSTSSPSGS